GERVAAGQRIERGDDVGIKREAGEGIEVVADGLDPALDDAKRPEAGSKAIATNILVAAVGLPITRNVVFFPDLPKGFYVDVPGVGRLQNALEGAIGAVAHIHQSAEDVERQEF